jgi:hypothetical protein
MTDTIYGVPLEQLMMRVRAWLKIVAEDDTRLASIEATFALYAYDLLEQENARLRAALADTDTQEHTP